MGSCSKRSACNGTTHKSRTVAYPGESVQEAYGTLAVATSTTCSNRVVRER